MEGKLNETVRNHCCQTGRLAAAVWRCGSSNRRSKRKKVVNKLDTYLAQAEETLKGKGTIVYHAKDADQARQLILDLCADKQKAGALCQSGAGGN